MTDHADVVIAGAGPAGAQCARDLAGRGYDVVLLETEPEETFPRQSNKSTGGTFPSMLTRFGIPDDVVMQFTESIVIESPTDHYERRQPGAVLDFGAFKRFLVEDAVDAGASVLFESRVSKPVMDDGRVVGVRYGGDREITADIVIDATGPAAPLAKALDVVDLKRNNHAIGIEYEYDNVALDHDGYADLNRAMMLRLDHEFAPGGYAWIFHTGDDTAKVGVCTIVNDAYRRHVNVERTVDEYLQHWLDTDPRLADVERIPDRVHRGSAHIQRPGRMSTDNFMAIGDTVPSIDPLWGEGIDKCMRSARVAAITADHALSLPDPDTSAGTMSIYDDLWHREVAPRVRPRLLMTELLYHASNERFDALVGALNRHSEDTLRRANDGDVRAILDLLRPSDLKLLGTVFYDRYVS